jgi:hypothetical protein
MNRPLYAALLAVTVLAAAGGVATLVPVALASYPNAIGCRSLCTFSPACLPHPRNQKREPMLRIAPESTILVVNESRSRG